MTDVPPSVRRAFTKRVKGQRHPPGLGEGQGALSAGAAGGTRPTPCPSPVSPRRPGVHALTDHPAVDTTLHTIQRGAQNHRRDTQHHTRQGPPHPRYRRLGVWRVLARPERSLLSAGAKPLPRLSSPRSMPLGGRLAAAGAPCRGALRRRRTARPRRRLCGGLGAEARGCAPQSLRPGGGCLVRGCVVGGTAGRRVFQGRALPRPARQVAVWQEGPAMAQKIRAVQQAEARPMGLTEPKTRRGTRGHGQG